MAVKVVIRLTFGSVEGALTLLDPIGTNNTWSCDPADYLSASDGSWSQGLGSNKIVLKAAGSLVDVLTFTDLNMFKPEVGQNGDAISSGDGGTVPDTQVVPWEISSVA